MFLHDIGFDKFNIACEDTLVSPQHWDDEPFELIVSNPPYSIIGNCETSYAITYVKAELKGD